MRGASRKPIDDSSMRGRIDAGDAHQRAQPRLLRLREPPQAEQRERAVLVDERHDVGDGRERDDVEVALEKRVLGAEQRLRELPDDAGAAQSGERVVALERRDDRAGGECVARPVVVGDDDLEPERVCVLDLGDRGDAAVDGEDEVEAFLGETRERVDVQAVALLEARRQVPRDLRRSSRSSSTASAVAQIPSAS